MKGLLIKDFRLLKGQVYFLLIVTVCVIVFMIMEAKRLAWLMYVPWWHYFHLQQSVMMNMKMVVHFYLPYRLQRKIM